MKAPMYAVLLVLFLAGSLAYAASGGNVGNGGVGVLCKDAHGLNVLEFFDLYEGRVLQNLTPVEISEDYKQRALGYAMQLDQLSSDGASQSGSYSFRDRVQAVMGMFKMLPSGVGLTPTGDVDSIVYPKHCEVKQILNYKNDGFVYVDTDLWNLLPASGKTAAVLHEVIYEYFRDFSPLSDVQLSGGDRTSVRARRAVALLLAGKSLERIRTVTEQNGSSKQWLCRTEEAASAGRPATEFYVTSARDGRQIIEFTQLNGRIMLSHASVAWQGAFETVALRQRVESLIDWDLEVEIHNVGDSGTADFEIGVIDGNERTKEKLVCAN